MSFTPHITVATVVERAGRFLFVEETDAGQRVINQPAGHLDAGETLIEAARRETLEETGWEVHIEGMLGLGLYQAPANDVTYYRTAFYGTAVQHRTNTLDEGIIAAHWLTRDELCDGDFTLRSPMVLTTLDQYLAGHRYPLSVFYHPPESYA